jgi:hypothetical protein
VVPNISGNGDKVEQSTGCDTHALLTASHLACSSFNIAEYFNTSIPHLIFLECGHRRQIATSDKQLYDWGDSLAQNDTGLFLVRLRSLYKLVQDTPGH